MHATIVFSSKQAKTIFTQNKAISIFLHVGSLSARKLSAAFLGYPDPWPGVKNKGHFLFWLKNVFLLLHIQFSNCLLLQIFTLWNADIF